MGEALGLHDVAHWHFFLRQHDWGRAGPSVWEGHLLHGSMHIYMPLDGQHQVGGMGEPLRRDMTLPICTYFRGNMLAQGLEGSLMSRDREGLCQVCWD